MPCEPDERTSQEGTGGLLGPGAIRDLAERFRVHPARQWGQHFVVDANTVRRIVRLAGVSADDVVVEVGPGLGSLTLALAQSAARVVAVEVDPALAEALPQIVAEFAPDRLEVVQVVQADALTLPNLPGPEPTSLVANLPYNVSVPVLLNFLERFPTIETGLVMVQLEVAQRLCAVPGTKDYGVPSLKTSWYAQTTLAGTVPRAVFWPVPRVDSGLVAFQRHRPPESARREDVFTCIDAAFSQRRKTLRAALAGWAGSADAAAEALARAGVDPKLRGEQLDINAFARITAQRPLR